MPMNSTALPRFAGRGTPEGYRRPATQVTPWIGIVVTLLALGCRADHDTIPVVPPPPPPPFVGLRTVVQGATDASLLAAYTDRQGTPWAGGSAGVVLTRRAGRWELEQLPGGGVVTGIWGGEADTLFATAGSELYIRTEKDSWQSVGVPGGGNVLLDIWGIGPGSLWIAGAGGTLLRRTPQGWTVASTGVREEIWGIGGASLGDVVAVGQNGLILESSDSGITWQKRPSPTARTLFAVASDPDGRVVAVGSGGAILLRDHSTWRTASSPTPFNLFDVRSNGAGRFTILGDGGTILEGDGETWHRVVVAGARENLRAVTGPPGQRTAVGWMGTILTESTGWGTVVAGGTLYAVHLPPRGAALAVGTGGLAFENVGGGWTPTSIPTPTSLYDIAGPTGDDRIAVGDSGTIMRQAHGQWSQETTVTGALLRSVWYDGTKAMAVGRGGTVLIREEGRWRPLFSGTSRFLRRVDGDRWDRLYIVGDSGTAFRWDGRSLAPLSVGTDANLRGIDAASDADVWFVGDRGTIIRGTANGWQAQRSPTTNDIRDIRRIGQARYIVGEFRQVYRLDDEGWTPIGAQSQGFWLDLAGTASLVVVGELGRIDEGFQ